MRCVQIWAGDGGAESVYFLKIFSNRNGVCLQGRHCRLHAALVKATQVDFRVQTQEKMQQAARTTLPKHGLANASRLSEGMGLKTGLKKSWEDKGFKSSIPKAHEVMARSSLMSQTKDQTTWFFPSTLPCCCVRWTKITLLSSENG